VFWSLSFAEWRALWRRGGEALDRAAFDALLSSYPDEPHGQ
jgi:hypothetical protein